MFMIKTPSVLSYFEIMHNARSTSDALRERIKIGEMETVIILTTGEMRAFAPPKLVREMKRRKAYDPEIYGGITVSQLSDPLETGGQNLTEMIQNAHDLDLLKQEVRSLKSQVYHILTISLAAHRLVDSGHLYKGKVQGKKQLRFLLSPIGRKTYNEAIKALEKIV